MTVGGFTDTNGLVLQSDRPSRTDLTDPGDHRWVDELPHEERSVESVERLRELYQDVQVEVRRSFPVQPEPGL